MGTRTSISIWQRINSKGTFSPRESWKWNVNLSIELRRLSKYYTARIKITRGAKWSANVIPPPPPRSREFIVRHNKRRRLNSSLKKEIAFYWREPRSNNKTWQSALRAGLIARLFPFFLPKQIASDATLVPAVIVPTLGEETAESSVKRSAREASSSPSRARFPWRTVKNKDSFCSYRRRGDATCVERGRKKPCGRRMAWKGSSFMETRQRE